MVEMPSKKRQYNRLDFSLEDEDTLIDFVKQNPALYDTKNQNHKNRLMKDQLWNKIGEKIGQTGTIKTHIL